MDTAELPRSCYRDEGSLTKLPSDLPEGAKDGLEDMDNYNLYTPNGVEVVINQTTGDTFLTPRGYSRLSGRPLDAVVSLLYSYLNNGYYPCYRCVLLTLSEDRRDIYGIMPSTMAFEWLQGDNPELANEIAKIGIDKYLTELVGTAVPTSLPSNGRVVLG